MRSQQGATEKTVDALSGVAASTPGCCGRTLFGEARVNPLSALYGAAVSVRNGLYDRGLIAVQRLEGPVVSIGNLAVGGSGKTPFLILLGELLKQRGIAFDVLSPRLPAPDEGVAIVDRTARLAPLATSRS